MQWHLGHSNLYHPTYRGFTTYTGLPYSGDMGCLDLNPRGCGDGHHAGPSCPARCGADDRVAAVTETATGTAIPLYASSNNWDGTNCSERNCSQEIVLAPFNPNSLNQVWAARPTPVHVVCVCACAWVDEGGMGGVTRAVPLW